MSDLLNTLITEYFGLTCLVIIILFCLIVFVIWWAATIYNRAKNLPCQNHSTAIDKHDIRVSALENKISAVDGKLTVLITMVSQLLKPSVAASNEIGFDEKHSPRVLNQNGEVLFQLFKGQDFLNENGDFLCQQIDELHPTNALDVENYCFPVLLSNSNNDRFIPLKNWVYNAPAQELITKNGEKKSTEISLQDVLSIISLKLRDLYLEKHPELVTK